MTRTASPFKHKLQRNPVKQICSLPVRWWLQIRQWHSRKQPLVSVERLNYLRRLLQIGSGLGFDRGLCIDRYYIEQFLSAHALDVRGRVLEIADDTYTQRFGGGPLCQYD